MGAGGTPGASGHRRPYLRENRDRPRRRLVRPHRCRASHRVGSQGSLTRREGFYSQRPGSPARRELSGWVVPGACSYALGDERVRCLRHGRREARVGQACGVCGGGGVGGHPVGASTPDRDLGITTRAIPPSRPGRPRYFLLCSDRAPSPKPRPSRRKCCGPWRASTGSSGRGLAAPMNAAAPRKRPTDHS
jgi:hypothetical protein